MCFSVLPSAICMHPMSVQMLRLPLPALRKPLFPSEGTAMLFIPLWEHSELLQSPQYPFMPPLRPWLQALSLLFPLSPRAHPLQSYPQHSGALPSPPGTLRSPPQFPSLGAQMPSVHLAGHYPPFLSLPARPHLITSPPSCSDPTLGKIGLSCICTVTPKGAGDR